MKAKYKNYETVMEYANSIVEGRKIACKETIEMCQRFLKDLDNNDYDFNPKDAEFVIGIIEKTFVHEKGEDMEGDRKSTRLNSSHVAISYAVFCLKKKRKTEN